MSGKRSNSARNWHNRQARAKSAKKPAMRSWCGKPYKPTGCQDMRPYSARRPEIIDELKARREKREARQMLRTVSKPEPILSDTEWCAEPPAFFETGLIYGPRKPTYSQWRQMRQAAKQAVRLEAGSVLSAAAKRQEQLREERVAGKVGFTSYSSLRQVVGV